MSVGVYYKPHGHHSEVYRNNPYKGDNIQKVKRQLFGPVDHEAAHRFVTHELEKHYTFQSERWNFDFKRGRTLKSDGIYDWRPATPVKMSKPLKRRPSHEIEYDNHEYYCLPEDICTPKPEKPEVNEDEQTPPKYTTQSLITDFMQIKKNSISDTSKKLLARPSKIPRLANELKS